MKKKIAVIGAGFFGLTISLILSKKFQVDIYEKENEILGGASRANQLRFHHGYHYPRSQKTVNEVLKYKEEFIKFYGKNIFGKTENYYGISKLNSKTNFKNYMKFLRKNNFFYKRVYLKEFSHLVSGQILSDEKNLNYFFFKKKVLRLIKKANVKIYYKKEFEKKNLEYYHKVIVCTYSQNNQVLKKIGITKLKKFKYELVEKIVIKLPNFFRNKSFMILDGKFVSLDPYLGTNYHLLSDVKHSKLKIKKSFFPNFKGNFEKFIGKNAIKNLNQSNFKKFIKSGSRYLPFLAKAKYIKSFYIIRTIMLNKEKTDERLNYIQQYNKKVISVLSGKWNTALGVAFNLFKLIK
jgi:hypothetical protein